MQRGKAIQFWAVVFLIVTGIGITSSFDVLSKGLFDQNISDALEISLGVQVPHTFILFNLITSFTLQILLFISALGLLFYKNWARKTTIVYAGLSIILTIIVTIYYSSIGANKILVILSFASSIAIDGLIYYYFSKKSMKKEFN